MTETQKRIEAYQKVLPDIKEKVAAVAMLLALSVIMLTSASFAWLTISRAPEVTSVATNVAANGNLEIALAKPDGSQPEESKVGDSFAAEGNSIVAANLTWGNLINLNDPSYGLDHLVLRPAQINPSSLLVSPLYGAVFSNDGRVEKLNSQFGYGIWDNEHSLFKISSDKGVRAISSVTVEAVGFAAQVYEKRSAASEANLMAGTLYNSITSNKSWMNSLSTVMGTFMTANLNKSEGDEKLTNPTLNNADVINLRDIFDAFIGVYEKQAEAMVALINYQEFLKVKGENYTPKTVEWLMGKDVTDAALKTQGYKIKGVDTLKADLVKLNDGYEKLVVLAETGNVKWADSGIDQIVNNLMNVSTCTLDGTRIGSIGASNASGYLDGKVHNAVITNGPLYNFEQINGTRCLVEKLTVSAKVKRIGMTIPASIEVNITTNAPIPSYFDSYLLEADGMNEGGKGEEVAQDTYGLAVDLWVRTNAEGSYLILEGNVLTETTYVEAMGKDANGNTVKLYTVAVSTTDEEGNTVRYSYDVYQGKRTVTNEDGTTEEVDAWYRADTHSIVTEVDLDGATPTAKMDEVVTVKGFEGENRVWDEAKGLSVDATTQGNGSCYIYYADTPEDQARSLDLLESMYVAFVDDKGTKLATAGMDTEHYYAQNGRVIVPLVLEQTDAVEIGTGDNGDKIYAITQLEKNVATRVTAIVYLDGTKLGNENVLSAADIQGQLNIQFGSSQSLVPINNEKLELEEIHVSASVDKTSFDYDKLAAAEKMISKVTVNIEGYQTNDNTTVKAFFLRSINSTQGSREQEFALTKQSDGTWTYDYEFTVPGNYVLRTIQIDGQEHVLTDPPKVSVTGFAVKSLNAGNSTIMTDKSSFTTDLDLEFATTDASKLPKAVQGRYINDETGAAVNVNFIVDSNQKWHGEATFFTSGDYTMQYLVLDGEYFELPEAFRKTASVKLGLRTEVYTSSPTTFIIDSNNESQVKELQMNAKILDNAGNAVPGLTGAKLWYTERSGLNPMAADLGWNATTGYYEGKMAVATDEDSSGGVFDFSRIEVGENTITTATTSPTFTIITMAIPRFVSNETESYQFSPNADASFKVKIKGAKTIKATIKDLEDGGKTETVDGKIGNDGMVTFAIPKRTNQYQDGEWQLLKLELWEVYDSNGILHTENPDAPEFAEVTAKTTDPFVIDDFVIDENIVDDPETEDVDESKGIIKTKVVNQVFISFSAGQSKEFGKENGEVTAEFMTQHKVEKESLSVEIKDYMGEEVSVSNVKLTFKYNGGTFNNGKYKLADGNRDLTTLEVPDIVINLDKKEGITYTNSEEATFLYAGNYTTEFSYTINKAVTLSGNGLPTNAPIFSVWSKAPTVEITAIGPTGTFSIDQTTANQLENDTAEVYKQSPLKYYGHIVTRSEHIFATNNNANIPEFSSNSAKVFYKCTHEDIATYGTTDRAYSEIEALGRLMAGIKYKYHDYVQPWVTITLTGIGNGESAMLAFAGANASDAVHVYSTAAGADPTGTFSWTKGTATCLRYIGKHVVSSENDSKIVAGTITANQLTVVYNDVTYVFTIPTITIKNEY